MFLDPRELHVEKDPITADSSILDELCKVQPNRLQHGWLSGRVPIGQLQTPGRVLMKRQLPTDKAWSGTPLHLLMEIESLSKASEFQLYVSNQKHVRKVMSRLEHELPKILPAVHIDLKEIYEGRGGAWDAWNTYSDELVSSHRADQPAATELPPPYNQALAQTTATSRRPSTPNSTKRLHEDDLSTNKRTRGLEWEWYETNYPLGSPTEENTPTSTRRRLSSQSTADNQSTQDGQSTRGIGTPQSVHSPLFDESSRDQSTQSYPSPGRQLTPIRPSAINCNNSDDTRDIGAQPYAVSEASTASLDQLNIKPTIFTTRPQAPPPPTITLTLTDLERLIAKTIQAQIPAIAAQVQTRNLATELTAWAQPSIADYIDTHMPEIMEEAVSAHVSDVNDELESAAASLHEIKDEAITEIRSAEESGMQEVHRGSQIAIDDLQEQSQRLSEALEDKCTELEDRLDAKMGSSATPVYTRHPPISGNSAKEAVKVFERFHKARLTSEEQVKVLLNIAKFNNAEVFTAADLESRRMLVAHWSGRKDYSLLPPPSAGAAE
ncbi:hypothetical protein KCU77_g3579, partial [Aureobasidium melanogenum]